MGCAPSTAGQGTRTTLSFQGQAVPTDFYKQVRALQPLCSQRLDVAHVSAGQVGVRELVLRKCSLDMIPTGTFSMTSLTSLDVAENELAMLPGLIANLSGLEVSRVGYVSAAHSHRPLCWCRWRWLYLCRYCGTSRDGSNIVESILLVVFLANFVVAA